MVFRRSERLVRALVLGIGFISLLRTVAADPVIVNTPNQNAATEAKTNQLDHDLSFGKSKSDNVQFKQHLDYERRQNAAAVQKLERIPGLRANSNHVEMANILREVVNSDTSQSIKQDVTRIALLQLAQYTEEKGEFEQAQQFLAEFVQRYPKDPYVPELLLRQGYIYQKMGAYARTISKLHDVLKASLSLEAVNLIYARRVALTAKTELGETHYNHGKYKTKRQKPTNGFSRKKRKNSTQSS